MAREKGTRCSEMQLAVNAAVSEVSILGGIPILPRDLHLQVLALITSGVGFPPSSVSTPASQGMPEFAVPTFVLTHFGLNPRACFIPHNICIWDSCLAASLILHFPQHL